MDFILPNALLRAVDCLTPAELRDWLSSPPMCTSLRIHHVSAEQFVERLRSEVQYAGDCFVHPVLNDTVIFPASRCEAEPSTIAPAATCSKWVVVDHLCGAAVLRGADIYVPGILAAAQDVGAGDEVQVFVNTRTRVLRGAKTPDILEECRFIARGVAKYARSEIFSSVCPKSGVGVAICWTEWRHPNFNAWPEELRDLLFAQNLPAVLVGHVAMNALANGPNKNRGRSSDHVRALDMCAAPGGKATHLASLLGDSGTVVAVDRSRRRLQAVEENFRRLGLKNGHTFCHDSTKLGNLVSADSASSGDRPAAFGTETFDVVLLDPPCSALGQRPVFRVEATDETVLANVVLQKALFRQAVDLLGPDGVLVYSTCTLSLEENEDVVHWALLTFGCLDLIPALPKLGGDGHRKSNLSPEERGMVQRFAPPPPTENSDGNCNVDCVGFFVACFRKKSGDLCV